MIDLLSIALNVLGVLVLLGLVLLPRSTADQIKQWSHTHHALAALALVLPFATGTVGVWAITGLGVLLLESSVPDAAFTPLWWLLQSGILGALLWRLWSFRWPWFYLASFILGIALGYGFSPLN